MDCKNFLFTLRRQFSSIRSFFCSSEMKKNAQAGFTLVELLTVMSLVALISSITLANVMGAKRLAKDAKTMQDIKSIIKVIQAYYLDHGYYPGLTATEANSPGNTYINFGCPTIKKCEYYPETEATECDSRKSCDCLTSPNDPAQQAIRRQMGWLPMLDGTFSSRDAYFTPVSTPKSERNIKCEPEITLIHPFKYLTSYSALNQRYIIFMEYFLDRPRANAPGTLVGCSSTFCLYNVTHKTISL